MTLRSLRWIAVPLGAVSLVCVYTFGFYPDRFVDGDPRLPVDVVSALKALVALVALGCSIYSAFRRATRRPLPRRLELGVATALAALGVVGYLNFGDVGYSRGYHRWELFHYYLGAKYQTALRYDRIYAATAVAQAEISPAMRREVESRSMRDLRTDEVVPAKDALDDAAAIKARFPPGEWESFRKDVAWFRASCDLDWWNLMQSDHGFNASPAWLLAGRAVAAIAPAGDTFFRCIATIDLLLLAFAFTSIAWAFGPRVACVALVFWGTQWPFDQTFTFGALLRQDWVFLLVVSACLAKKRRYALAGAALAYSASIRVFPGLFFLPVLVAAGVQVATVRGAEKWRALRPAKRFFAGAALAGALLGVTTVGTCGIGAYREFAGRIAAHSEAASSNLMGVRSIVAFSWPFRIDATREKDARDEFGRWKALRAERVERRAPLVILGGCLTVFLVGWAVRRRRPLWVCFPIGLLLVMGLVEMSNYYYAVFLLLPLLARFGPSFEVLALATSALSALFVTWTRVSSALDSRCYFQSWLFLLACLVVVVSFAGRGRRRSRAAAPSQPPPELAPEPG